MKVKVKLYGTLRQSFPDYQHSQGIEVEIPEGATVKDLLTLLEISASRGAVVIMEGRVLKADDKMRCGVPVNVLQAIQGGRYVCVLSEVGGEKWAIQGGQRSNS